MPRRPAGAPDDNTPAVNAYENRRRIWITLLQGDLFASPIPFRKRTDGRHEWCRYLSVMVALVLIAGSMTLGVVLSRATLSAVFRVAEYARSIRTRSL